MQIRPLSCYNYSKTLNQPSVQRCAGFSRHLQQDVVSFSGSEKLSETSTKKNADFRKSNITNLGELQSIGDCADFSNSKIAPLEDAQLAEKLRHINKNNNL